MSLRTTIQNSPMLAVAMIATCLILAGWISFVGRGGKDENLSTQRWFYDLETGELFASSAGLEHLPPVRRDNGHEAVWAHVFACESCVDKSTQQVGYLEMYTELGKQQMFNPAASPGPAPGAPAKGPLQQVAVPGSELSWVDINSQTGAQIVQLARRHACPDGSTVECFPGQ